MANPSSAQSQVTTRQHLTLLGIVLVGAMLILYFIQTRSINPRKQALDRQMRNSQNQLTNLQTQLATREAMDLEALKKKLAEAQEKLRTAEISGATSGQPFLNDHDLAQVAAFQSSISDLAAQNRLAIRSHSAINSTDAQLDDLILRELNVLGTYTDFVNFIDSLNKLPYRIIIIKVEIENDPDQPGKLSSTLRYSV